MPCPLTSVWSSHWPAVGPCTLREEEERGVDSIEEAVDDNFEDDYECEDSDAYYIHGIIEQGDVKVDAQGEFNYKDEKRGHGNTDHDSTEY